MAKKHDRWYTRIFSDPKLVEELLRNFVPEKFVDLLDYSSLKKLNTKFVPESERTRHSDIIYEVKLLKGGPAYIYIFMEFQSTVDRFMALRLARYILEMQQEVQKLNKSKHLIPTFPILIYSGDDTWDAPTQLRDLFIRSGIPSRYLPQFGYYKLAVNEIPKRDLVKMRNAVATIFYVENSSPEDIVKQRKTLVRLLKGVIKNEGINVVRAIVDRLIRNLDIPANSAVIKSIDDLEEITHMFETRLKNDLKRKFEEGIEEGIEQTVMRADSMGLDVTTIAQIAGIGSEDVKRIIKKNSR